MTTSSDKDFDLIGQMSLPVKRAAYSDRTAWIMAILSELAYEPLEEESDAWILKLAEDLAEVTDQADIADRLRELRGVLYRLRQDPGRDVGNNAALRAALAAGGFDLVGVLFNAATDTQGFVACRRGDTGMRMAVVCFRGTKETKDWLTNIDMSAEPVRPLRGGGIVGNMHRGFHDAYKSVEIDVANHLSSCGDLPVYITGHSLGGALAVVATWYQSSDRLAACYTFGAPRAGDQGLIDRFKTPIYRIVNVADPVPFTPPAGITIDALKAILRIVRSVFPFWGIADWVIRRLIKVQRFRHYGYMRYLTNAEPGSDGSYPKLCVEFAVSNLRRLMHLLGACRRGRGHRIDKYHKMSRYRDKLRAYAVRRNDA